MTQATLWAVVFVVAAVAIVVYIFFVWVAMFGDLGP